PPPWRRDVGVVQHFSHGGEHVEPCRCGDGTAKQAEDEKTRDDGVRCDFKRMLVERGDCLDACWAVMNLVKRTPQKVAGMTSAMPPVEDEGADEPGKQASEWSRNMAGDLKDRPAMEPLIPCVTGEDDDAELRGIQESGSREPGRRIRKVSAGKDSFEKDQDERSEEDDAELQHRSSC